MGNLGMMRTCAIAMLALTLGCGGDSTGPEALPRVGRYAYSMAVPVNATSPNLRTFSGTLVLTFVSSDSLAGHWEVPASAYQTGGTGAGFDRRLALGFFNGGGWYFFAYPSDGGTVQHRLFPGSAPRCEGAALYMSSGGDVQRRDGTCTVSYLGS